MKYPKVPQNFIPLQRLEKFPSCEKCLQFKGHRIMIDHQNSVKFAAQLGEILEMLISSIRNQL